MKRLFLGITVALVIVGVTLSGSHSSFAVTQVDTTRFFVDPATLPFGALAGTPTSRYWGVSNGAGWRIEVPDNWNGDLVLYAHGYAGTGAQLFVQTPSLRAFLISNGYAWAASSYRANGYVPGTGAEDTYDLLKIFKQTRKDDGKKGNPNRVYLYGVSMGGHIVGHMIERWRNSFAGALPVCGVMGDNELFDFFQDMYLVAETLVGNTPVVPTPADYYTNPTKGWLVTRTKLGTPYPTVLTPTGTLFKQIIENLSGGDRPVYDQGFVGPNGGDFAFNFGSAVAGPGRENFDTVYQFDTNPALTAEEQQFNNTVIRITASTQDRDKNGLFTQVTSSPAITAKFKIPVLTLHTLGDLFVPFSMEQVYARRAIAAGTDDLLVQRAIRGRGHCEFTAAELTTGFDNLVNWVVNGVKPQGDDILDPATVAAPNFGCKFTSVTHHPSIPVCP
jgi:pimeloyl-ACP methyl ester carboxylesterase